MSRVACTTILAVALILSGPAAAEETEAATDARPYETPELIPPLDLGFGVPKLSIRGFGHAQYQASWIDPAIGPNVSTNNFANGGVDLYITSRIAQDFTFLNETVFEFGPGGENILDVERVFLKWEFRDWLQAGIGRGHTALGYWNQHFHHGTWLQTTSDRPLIYDFEDDGGILPVHFVGLELSGRATTEIGSFTYAGSVSNGRGEITDHVQLVEDQNRNKAITLLARFEPGCLTGLGFGASAHFDKISPNPAPSDGTPPRAFSMKEQIYGAHVFYIVGPIELLSEFSAIYHEPQGSTPEFVHYGGYTLLSYKIASKLRPYYRFDFLSIDAKDPFYSGLVEDTRRHTVGIRFDLRTFVALKAEYQHLHKTSSDENFVVLQASFAF